jgi:hypothetical protein
MLIPSTILFIEPDAIHIASQICFLDGDSCPAFDRWLPPKPSRIAIDFRRIQKMGFNLPSLGDYIANLSEFEERSIFSQSSEVSSQISCRVEDQLLVIVKSITHSRIENSINLRHPCIVGPIGFVLPIESGSQRELKTVRLYSEACSLLEVVSVNPIWWTSTVKAKVIAGIVLGLQFAHSLGLVHGHLTASNILFDENHDIQMVDFQPILLEVGEMESEDGTQRTGVSGERWTPKMDVHAFALILFEIVVGRPANGEASIPRGIPDFVSMIIESGLSAICGRHYSFNAILEILKQNDFQIEDGVDSAEVSAFVSWVESA